MRFGRITYNVQGEVGSIGNLGSSVEVPAIGIGLECDMAFGDLGTVENIETLDFQGLLEIDAGLTV